MMVKKFFWLYKNFIDIITYGQLYYCYSTKNLKIFEKRKGDKKLWELI